MRPMAVTAANVATIHNKQEAEMSMMCKMNGSCETTHGMCIHEKMMLGMVVLIAAGVAVWFFI